MADKMVDKAVKILEHLASEWVHGRRKIRDLELRLSEAHRQLGDKSEISVRLHRHESGLIARNYDRLKTMSAIVSSELELPDLFAVDVLEEDIRNMIRGRLKAEFAKGAAVRVHLS